MMIIPDLNKIAYIRQISKEKWRIFSESGKNLGTYNSKGQAEKRLKEIEMFKSISKKRRKRAFFVLSQSIEENTYSATMRKLNKEHPGKIEEFMKAYKEAFDNALNQNLEDHQEIALLQAKQKVNI